MNAVFKIHCFRFVILKSPGTPTSNDHCRFSKNRERWDAFINGISLSGGQYFIYHVQGSHILRLEVLEFL